MIRKNQTTQGIFLMLLGGVSFALMAASAKFCSKTLHTTEIIFVRSLVATLLFFFLLLKTKASMIGKEPWVLAARGVVGFVALWLYFWSLSQIDLGTAVMLNYTGPIFAVLYALLIFKEQSGWRVKVLVLGSFLGVALLTAPQLHLRPLPLLAALFSGCLVGIVHILIRYSHAEESPLTIIFYFSLIATAGSTLLMLKTGFVMPQETDGWGLLTVTMTSILGQLGLTYALRKAPIFVVSPFAYITPVVGLYLGWLLWNEIPNNLALLGSALVVLCGVLLFHVHADS